MRNKYFLFILVAFTLSGCIHVHILENVKGDIKTEDIKSIFESNTNAANTKEFPQPPRMKDLIEETKQ